MPKVRSKVWTVIFACLPGAGHMFMGLMKLGLSYMAMFFLVIFFASVSGMGAFVYLLPLIWFYSFFDCVNKVCLSSEELARERDRFLFTDPDGAQRPFSGRLRPFAGAVLILAGLVGIWNAVLSLLHGSIPEEVYSAVASVGDRLPQLLAAGVIIALGLWLIIGRKKQAEG
jgi:hypothetical protein